ncbi:hypothetical protein F4677DRAFT_408150 [Hypoxylon crocopeplum]|nr:hypothetical protein F4677DRAFT_408150 [Hypoxylon crocopeplum]
MASKFTSLFQISIWLLAGQVYCGSIAGWWNGRGPSFIMQDDDTGNIRYSLCNGNHTPIFPDDRTLAVPFREHTPKNKTGLTATGWMADTAVASIFYMDEDDNIVNAVLSCDWNTGHWQNTGEFTISQGSPKVSPTSGLSAVLLGSTNGYRVYYNDLDGTLHQIGYTPTTTWGYYGVVSHDKASSQAIASTFSGNDNITVVRPRDDLNMGVSRWYTDNLWHVSAFPQNLTLAGNHSTNATSATDFKLNTTETPAFDLPSWAGNTTSLAVGVDKAYTRSVFYIGTDRQLYQIGNKNYRWSVFNRPSDANAWPAADVAGGPVGIASDFASSVTRLYYMSNGRMVEVNGDGGNWQTATVLATVNATQVTETPSANPSATDAPAPVNAGLSDGAKAGISVGVTLGVIAVGGMAFAFWFLRRRQQKLDADAAAAAAAGSTGSEKYMSPGSGFAAPATTGTFSQTGSRDGYAAQPQGYTPIQNAYGQQAGYAPQQSGYQQPGYAQDAGGWAAYGTPTADGGVQQQQGYFYQEPPLPPPPQEMPSQSRPVEMMGEDHYKEVP